jgi:hypothetical protein
LNYTSGSIPTKVQEIRSIKQEVAEVLTNNGIPLGRIIETMFAPVPKIMSWNPVEGTNPPVPTYTHADTTIIACELQFLLAHHDADIPTRGPLRPPLSAPEKFQSYLDKVLIALTSNVHQEDRTPMLYDIYLQTAHYIISKHAETKAVGAFLRFAVEYLIKRLCGFDMLYLELGHYKDVVLSMEQFHILILRYQLRRHFICRDLYDPQIVALHSEEPYKLTDFDGVLEVLWGSNVVNSGRQSLG